MSLEFGSGLSVAGTARKAALDAADRASAGRREPPRLALVFGSVQYPDVEEAAAGLVDRFGARTAVLGASSGGAIFSGREVREKGVVVVLVGGDALHVAVESASELEADPGSAEAAAARLRPFWLEAAQRGLRERAVLVLATPFHTEADVLIAAIRRGAGPEAQLVGGLAGDDLRFEKAYVLRGKAAMADGVVLAGLATARPLGVGVRHGWRSVSRSLRITAASGPLLEELEGRPALDVWLEEIRRAGGDPDGLSGPDLTRFLCTSWELGVGVAGKEPVVRAPFAVGKRGAVRLAAALRPGLCATVMHAEPESLVLAAAESARMARARVGEEVSGLLVFSCTARLSAHGGTLDQELAALAGRSRTPLAGFCTYGEFARARGDVDGFHNTTCVTVALPR